MRSAKALFPPIVADADAIALFPSVVVVLIPPPTTAAQSPDAKFVLPPPVNEASPLDVFTNPIAIELVADEATVFPIEILLVPEAVARRPAEKESAPDATSVAVERTRDKSTAPAPLAFPPTPVPSGFGPAINAPVPFGVRTKSEFVAVVFSEIVTFVDTL